MAAYGTDLTTLADGDSDAVETWTELASPYNAGGSPADDDENLIQGVNCQSQTTGTKTGLVFSIVYDAGSDISASFVTDDVVLLWHFYAVISNLATNANGGRRAVIGADLTNADAYSVGGSDDPYAASWKNVAVDPTKTADYTLGTGNAGAWRYFGTMPNTINAISKGTPHATDAIRYGRGEIYCTGLACDFTGMAAANDDNSNPYNRWGLFQDQGGTYLWKGLMSLGQAATSATLSDSNKTILVDDTPAVYAAFNKIEVRHASSSVTLTNITVISLGTTSPGAFEMVENATVTLSGCSFNNMSTFIFLSNGDITGGAWNSCDLVTQGGATFNGSNFDSSIGATSLLVDNLDLVSNCDFASDGSNHAIELTSAHAGNSYTLTGCTYSNYAVIDGSTGNEVIYNNSGGAVTISIDGGDTPTVRNGAGASTSIVNNKSITFTGLKDNTEIRIYTAGTTTELAGIENATVGTVDDRSWTVSLPAASSVDYRIHNVTYVTIEVYTFTWPSVNQSLPVAQQFDRVYFNP